MARLSTTTANLKNNMAKRFDPFPTSSTPLEFNQTVRSYTVNGIIVAKYAAEPPTPSAETIAEMSEIYASAKLAWSNLHGWKKARWALCAISLYGDSVTNTGAKGYSAYALYIKCFLEQRPEPNHQPISPCSARVTDPFASPWNYQP